MSEFNPYQPPSAEVDGAGRDLPRGAGRATPAMMEHLRTTSPWVLFLAIIAFIFSGLTLLGGLSVVVMIPASMAAGGNEEMPSTIGLVVTMALFYLIIGAAYGVGGYFLVRYYRAISRLMRTEAIADVEEALGAQSTFWKTAGIITIGLIIAGILLTIGMFILSFAIVASGPGGPS